MEIWRIIVDFPGYQVSNMGRVKSIPRKSANGRSLRGKVLSPRTDRDGYKDVLLSVNGDHKRVFVHRMVARAFLLEAHTDETVNHENGIRDDNRAENLTWMTLQENIQHAQDNEYAIAYQQ
jgi:hypothetical protein